MDSMMIGMGFGWLVHIVAVAVLVLAMSAIAWLVDRLRVGSNTDRTGLGAPLEEDAARDLLRKRYAAGEIDDEEFERRLSGLTWR